MIAAQKAPMIHISKRLRPFLDYLSIQNLLVNWKKRKLQKQYKLFPSKEKIKRSGRKAEQEQTTPAPESNRKYIIAVTACPTGIAHTYMAEDALKKKQKKWA